VVPSNLLKVVTLLAQKRNLAQLCNKLCNGSSGFIINETPTMTFEDMNIVMFVLGKPKTT
jgi:hypothetical protein